MATTLTVAFANTQGHFQLNVYKPVILHNVLESIELLADASRSFDRYCARGIEPNLDRISQHVEESLMLVTALNPHIGYEKLGRDRAGRAPPGHVAARRGDRLGTRHRRAVRRWIQPGGDGEPAWTASLSYQLRLRANAPY